ncbi:hypothetical protein IJF81_04620 [bacterium]|nr:hypothetical protein [bacterium]
MRKLNILIWFFGDDVEHLYKTFIILHTHYKIEKSNIKTIIAKYNLPFQKTDLNNIFLEEIDKTSFDYLIVTGFPPPTFIIVYLLRKLLLKK